MKKMSKQTKKLQAFKKHRKEHGTFHSIYWNLWKANVREERCEQFVDALVSDLGIRGIEQMRSKDLLDVCDGFIAHEEEYLLTYQD